MFKKHRLEVELVWIQGGPRVVQALIAGNIDIGTTGGPDPVSAILGGAEIKIIASNHNSMDAAIIADKNITRPAELKGKKFAAGVVGSTGYLRAEFALRRWGLEPNRDVFSSSWKYSNSICCTSVRASRSNPGFPTRGLHGKEDGI